MPESREAFLARRKSELQVRLRAAHDDLTNVQDEHNATPYRCDRSGHCCKVGLQLHMMENQYVAENLQRTYEGDPDGMEAVIDRLEHAFTDKGYTWDEGVGDHMCAFFEDGCSVYPFRPAVCRMYGVVLEVDEWCPRKRLPSGQPFVFAQKETDRLMAEFYRTLDTYGRLFPKLDYTIYMPAGVLTFLLPPARLRKLKASTPKKFWRTQKGYRTHYQPSYRKTPARRSNVVFPFALPTVGMPVAASAPVEAQAKR
jgi:Fe-S-cluster containining protein